MIVYPHGIDAPGQAISWLGASARSLTPREYKACYSLNMRNDGFMRESLRRYKSMAQEYSYVEMGFTQDDILVAWSLRHRSFNPEGVPSPWNLNVYVRKDWRRLGLGGRLLSQALRASPAPIQVTPHDPASEALFEKAIQRKRAYDPMDRIAELAD